MPPQRLAYVCALSAVLLWSSVSTAFKLTLRHMASLQLVLVACAISLVVLGTMLSVRGKWGALRALSGRDMAQGILLGVLNPFLYYTILFMAYERLPAHMAQPINYTWAVMLALLSVPFMGHRLTRGEVGAMGLAYLGVVVIATGGQWPLSGEAQVDTAGVGLALLSTVLWAVYWIANARSRVDPVVNLFLNTASALPCVLAATVLGPGLGVFANLSAGAWAGALYIGVFEMGITSVLWLMALRLTDSTARVATLIFLAPFLSMIWFSLILKEHIGPSTLVGLVLVVGGSFLQQRLSRPTTESPSPPSPEEPEPAGEGRAGEGRA